MTLLDCAFSFFKNFPCRLTLAEMKFDLPCDESLFAAHHPFLQPNFQCSRHVTVLEAFRSLFTDQYRQQEITISSHRPQPKPSSPDTSTSNPLCLNALDMVILVHSMDVFFPHHQATDAS
jgi:hypothetical protein